MKIISTIVPLFFLLFLAYAACSSSEEQKTKADPAPASLSPGTAKINALIQSIEEEGNNLICNLKVNEVLGYGSATPAIAKGSEMILKVRKKVVEKLDEEIMNNAAYNLLLSFEQEMGSQNGNWSIIEISK